MIIVVVGPSRLSETFCVANLGTPELSLIGVENPAKQNLVRGGGGGSGSRAEVGVLRPIRLERFKRILRLPSPIRSKKPQ